MERSKTFNYTYQVKPSNRHIDENGFLTVKNCFLLHDGEMEYKGSELGDCVDGIKINPDKTYRVNISYNELLKCKDSFSMKPVTYGHVFLGKDGKNPLHYQEGSVGENIEIKNETDEDGQTKNFLMATVAFNNLQTVEAIQRGRKQELSTSYSNLLKKADADSHYDFEAIDIVGNHVALVRKGRAGSKVKVANGDMETDDDDDDTELIQIENNNMESNMKNNETENCSKIDSNLLDTESKDNTEDSNKNLTENEDINDYLNIKTEISYDEHGNKIIKISEPAGNNTSVGEFTNSDVLNHTQKTSTDINHTQKTSIDIQPIKSEIYSLLDNLRNLIGRIDFLGNSVLSNSEPIDEEGIYRKAREELTEENRNVIRAFNEVKPRVGDFDFTDMTEADIYRKGLKSCKKIMLNGDESTETLRSMFRTMNAVDNKLNTTEASVETEHKLPEHIKRRYI